MVAEDHLRPLSQGGGQGGRRGVQAHGQTAHFCAAGRHLQAGKIPGRSLPQRRNFFYGVNNFNQLHVFHRE